MSKLQVLNHEIKTESINYADYISLTDIAKYKDKEGNIRDYANIIELVCLVNLENLNSVYINENLSQSERLIKLNKVAVNQMTILTNDNRVHRLKNINNKKEESL